jgi:LPXTG-motif cell wall-anchored protein
MRRISMKRAMAAFALALLALLVPSTAAFAQYNVPPTLTVSQTAIAPCGTATLVGTNFLPNHEVTITANGIVIGTVTTDAAGSFSFPYTIPCDAVSGNIEFRATDGVNTLSVNVMVTGTTVPTPGALPKTGAGSTTQTLIRIGVLLIAAGGMVVIATRRRSARSQV